MTVETLGREGEDGHLARTKLRAWKSLDDFLGEQTATYGLKYLRAQNGSTFLVRAGVRHLERSRLAVTVVKCVPPKDHPGLAVFSFASRAAGAREPHTIEMVGVLNMATGQPNGRDIGVITRSNEYDCDQIHRTLANTIYSPELTEQAAQQLALEHGLVDISPAAPGTALGDIALRPDGS